MVDHRIVHNGARLDYTCANSRFSTNINFGHPHAQHPALGSVFEGPLVRNDFGDSLWLEHVSDNRDPDAGYYWLMWYNDSGHPNIPMSGILGRDHIAEMHQLFARFIPMP
jgi:hypothetical protein